MLIFVFYINGIMFSVSVYYLLLFFFFWPWQYISFFSMSLISNYLILCTCCIVFHGWLYLNLFTIYLLMEIWIVPNFVPAKFMWVCLWTIHEKWNSWFTKYGFETFRWCVKIQCSLHKLQDPSNGLKNLLATL